MKIAVTGGMGFIGHELVDRLITLGHEVVVVDFSQQLIPRYETYSMPIMEQLYRILPACSDVVDPWAFVANFTKYYPDIVVHAGAIANTKDLGGGSSNLFSYNVEYTKLLAQACDIAGANLIFISSASVYGTSGYPNNPYGLTKALGEKIVAKIRTRSTSLRLFNVFGRYEHHKGEMASVPWKLATAYRKNDVFAMHSPNAARDHVSSAAVVSAVVYAANEMLEPGEKWHRVYDVGTGFALTYDGLDDAIMKVMKKSESRVKIVEQPADLKGRYQFYTCAGSNGVVNIGNVGGTTFDGIKEAYGVDK